MDDVKLGGRLFLKQKTTWLIFTLGVALFCCVNYILLASAFHINLDRPQWVTNNANLFTLGALSPSGKLEPLTEQALQLIAQQGFVKDFALIGKSYTMDFRIGDHKFNAASVLYSPELFSLLQVQGMASSSESVWISNDFWHDELASMPLKGAVLHIEGSQTSYPIAGVLPENIRLQNPLPNTLWLPKNAQNDVLKVNFTTQMPEALLNELKIQLAALTPQWYGIFVSDPWRSTESIQADLNQLTQSKTNHGGITIYSRQLPTHLISGFSFRPEQKAALFQLLIISVFMGGAIGLVVFLSLISQYWNNMISRKQEFEIRIAVGGRPWPIFLQLLKEQFFFILLIIMIGAILIGFCHYFLIGTILQDVSSPLSLIISSILLTAFGLALVLCLCLAIPLLIFFNSKNVFNRAKTGQSTPKQRFFIESNMITQAMIALLLISIAYGAYLATIKVNNSLAINIALRQVQLSTAKDTLDWRMVSQYLQQQGLAGEVALISEALVQPKDRSVSMSSHSVDDLQQQVVTAYFTSANFMQFMGLSKGKVKENSIWLNHAAVARLFNTSTSESSVYIKDLPLNVTDPTAALHIAGVIENLPHFGLLHQKTPIVYLPYSQALSIISGVTVLYHPEQEAKIQNLLQHLSSLYGTELKVVDLGSIEDQLSKANKLEITLMHSTLWLSVIMMSIVALSFYSLLDAETKREQGTFGLQLAVGADLLSLMFDRYRLIGKLYVVASFFWLGMALLLDSWLKDTIAIELLYWRNYAVSSLIMLLILGCSCSIPFFQLKHKSIYMLLKC